MGQLGKALGCAIRRQRRELGLSQETLSEHADVHWTYISHIENGQSSPTFRVLERLAGALQIEVSVLVRMAEEIRAEEAVE
ncbi:MAG: helix-turn-helix transcriptional regulator [Chloroflexota bacterium]|nr:helix-turn-helix transcriptional regulator [Chloroflexota bacterium]MDE2947907.1 helix-turn-helix transcriptional regulator [Chloroflexota bacterium]